MSSATELWPIPEGLSPLGHLAAETIRTFLTEHDLLIHGGGGKFYTPEQWRDRGEQWGGDSLLIVIHDGGDHSGAFNLDHGMYTLHEAMVQRLADVGVFAEQATSWYSTIWER